MSPPDLTLYTFGTPNGQKASIALEELGLKYKVHSISFAKNEQKEEWFLKINPNGRIPALVDHTRGDYAVFESGAILLYLAEYYDPNHILLSEDPKEKYEAISWLMWQMGGLGPMQGQANHFYRFAPEKVPYGIKRYQEETKRLYSVMELSLSKGREYLSGRYSVADIASFGWVCGNQFTFGTDFELEAEFPLLNAWLHRLGKRQAVIAGMSVPTKSNIIEDGFKIKISAEEVEKVATQANKWFTQEKK
ncbi:glutathione S-transferase [Chytriomyces sp. MP71]|nr:glutathione S-transferase [Chytriomyces sp. MP71]